MHYLHLKKRRNKRGRRELLKLNSCHKHTLKRIHLQICLPFLLCKISTAGSNTSATKVYSAVIFVNAIFYYASWIMNTHHANCYYIPQISSKSFHKHMNIFSEFYLLNPSIKMPKFNTNSYNDNTFDKMLF